MPYCLATIALVVQIFLPCYFANKVISFSSELSMRAYESNWVEMTVSKQMHIKFNKCFFILFERLKRDTQVTIGMVFPLSLTTFTSVSNSYTSVLSVRNNVRFSCFVSASDCKRCLQTFHGSLNKIDSNFKFIN